MANESFDEFLRNSVNYNGGALEYFEDTHDAAGNYIGNRGFSAPQSTAPNAFGGQYSPQSHAPQPQQYSAPPQYGQYRPQQQPTQPPQYGRPSEAARRTEDDLSRPTQFKYTTTAQEQPAKKAVPLPDLDQFVSPRMYQNIAMYSPKNGADVERLIDFLRRREPAIIDLDPIADTPDAQRILDFTSGAVYALGGSIVPMKENSFIVVPDGITIVKTETDQ